MLQEETLARKFVRKGFWLYFFTFLIGPLGYITKMIITRDLTVEEVGMIYGVISLVTIISSYNDLGCTESLNFFMPKHILRKEFSKAKYLLKLTLISQGASSLTIALVLFIFAPWLAENYFHNSLVTEILRISGLFFVGSNILHIANTIFSVAQNTKLQYQMGFIRMFFTSTGAVLLFFFDTGSIENYMWIWVGGVFFAMFFSLYYAYNRYYREYFLGIKSEGGRNERSEFFRYSAVTLFTSNIATMFSQIDIQLIIFMLGNKDAGYYTTYLSLLNIPFLLIVPIITFLFPVISELNGREDYKKMGVIHEQFSLYFTIIGIWLGVFLLQFGEHFSMLFFGEAFQKSGDILKYSAPFLIFNLLIQINFQILSGIGKIRERARILMIVLPINFILNVSFIYFFGIEGSALAVGLSWIPLWYLSHKATREFHGTFTLSPIIKNLVLAIIAYGTLAILLKIFLIPGNLFPIFFAVLINLIIFSGGNSHLLKEMWTTIQRNRK